MVYCAGHTARRLITSRAKLQKQTHWTREQLTRPDGGKGQPRVQHSRV